MALKVTIEKVANGTMPHGSFHIRGLNYLNPTQDAMIAIIEQPNHVLGDAVLWSYLEGVLGVFANGTVGTGITGIVSGSSLAVAIVAAVTEQIGTSTPK